VTFSGSFSEKSSKLYFLADSSFGIDEAMGRFFSAVVARKNETRASGLEF
jgi:hypothetical protein